MKVIFWISLAGILYTYAAYPLAVWIVARLHPRPWKTGAITPSISIVLAVHNGAALLPGKIRHLLRLNYHDLCEIIVVSDGSTDGTEDLLMQMRHPLIKSIVLSQHQGKAAALNAGMAAATGEVILFVDIRPEIADGAIQQLMSNFADSRVGCVSGNLHLHREGQDATCSAVGGLYWRYEQWTRRWEARCAAPVGVYGGFYAVRRELAVAQPPGIILDDMFQPLAVMRQGYRTVFDSQAAVFDTWPKTANGEFHRKVRTLAGNFQLLRLAPWVLTPQNPVLFQLISHKLLRLVAPYFWMLMLAAAVVLAPASPAYAAVAAVLALGVMLAIAGLCFRVSGLHRIAAPASALLLLNAAAVAGLYRFLFTSGPLWKIWYSGVPAPSAAPLDETTSAAQAGSLATLMDFDESLYANTLQQNKTQEHVAVV